MTRGDWIGLAVAVLICGPVLVLGFMGLFGWLLTEADADLRKQWGME